MIQILIRASEVDPDTVRPGWVAFLIIAALGVATFLLWRNMGKQMRKIRFDDEPPVAPPEPHGPDESPRRPGDPRAGSGRDEAPPADENAEPEHSDPEQATGDRRARPTDT